MSFFDYFGQKWSTFVEIRGRTTSIHRHQGSAVPADIVYPTHILEDDCYSTGISVPNTGRIQEGNTNPFAGA